MYNQNKQTEEISYPWIVFKVDGVQYAINSQFVSGILMMPDTISEIPESPDFLRGIFQLRGSSIPLVDYRTLIGLPSLTGQYQEFIAMIDQRKQDHLNWVHVLKRCMADCTPFPLTTNPHKCAFGQWYDQYETENPFVGHVLKKIDTPHQELHKIADKVSDCLLHSDFTQHEDCRENALKELDDNLLPTILHLLDNTKDAMQKSYQEMVLILNDQNNSVGLIIDEVLSVEELSMADDSQDNMSKFHSMKYVSGISKNSSGIVLLVNTPYLLNNSSGFETADLNVQ